MSSESAQISEDIGSIEELYSKIGNQKKAWVFAHTNPDADAYGSSCGLALGLRNLGVDTTLFNEMGVVSRYSSIPGVKEVSKVLPPLSEINDEVAVIVCDCGAIERLGDSYLPWFKEVRSVINIDHHHANTQFGWYNLVHESASSTSEIVFSLLMHAEKLDPSKIVVDEHVATALMAGIIGDTGSFRYPSTSRKTFLAAAELYSRGARPGDIVRELFASVSLPALRLQSEALTKVVLHHSGRFAEVVVSTEMVERLGAEILDADSLAERARDIQGVCVSALFKQDNDIWRVSLRSRSPAFDVSAIARSFGGGGHKPAAAFRWRRDLAALQGELRGRVEQLLNGSFEEKVSSTGT